MPPPRERGLLAQNTQEARGNYNQERDRVSSFVLVCIHLFTAWAGKSSEKNTLFPELSIQKKILIYVL